MPLQIAFTGTGYISRVHADAARKLPDVALSAVVNHRAESRAKFAADFNIPRQFDDVEALLASGGVDALVISTPNHLHAPQTIMALRAGVHVMVEKPMAMNALEAALMLKASEASRAKLMVAHNWRFDPEAIWLRQRVETGRLGETIRTKSYSVHVNWGPSGWFTQKQYAGGGAMADMGIHALDTTRFLLGDPQPTSVYARIGTYYQDFDVDDTGMVIVNWENGVTSYIESGWWQPHVDAPQAATQLYGTRGFGQLYPTRLKLMPGAGAKFEELDGPFPPTRQPHAPQSMYDAQMAYFVECIRADRTPVPGGTEGWVNMRIVDAAYESARTGEVVKL